MAAFSFQHYPFVLDSAGLPNPTIKISGLLQEGEMNDSLIFPFYQYDSLPDYAFSPTANASGCFGNGAAAVAEKLTIDSSSVVTQADGVDHVAHQQAPVDKKRKSRDGSCLNSPESKEGKGRKQKKCGSSMIKTEEKKPKAEKKSHKKACEDPPTDYIHVRARRGQATDSHSLAERVRREKISERMRQLQGLVPGCDKVIGKALMLDEIINYVQSLQNQVEFLSTKLALYDFGADLSDCTANSQGLGIPSTFPCRQQSPAFRDSTTEAVPTANSYLLMDGRDPLLLQGQRPDAFPQENSNLVWEMEDQRNGIASPAGYCNICSFQEKDYPPNIW